MSRESPVAVLYDANGVALSVRDGVAIPANTPGIHAMVSDGTSSRYLAGTSRGGMYTRNQEDPTYIAAATQVIPASNKSMFSLRNGGASFVVRVSNIFAVNTAVTAITGLVASFQAHRYTTEALGIAVTPQPFDTNDTLPVGITAGTGRTVAGETVLPLWRRLWSTDEWGTGTLDQEGYDHAVQSTFPLYQHGPGEKPITLRNGEGLHIKFVAASIVGSWDFFCTFTTEAA